MLAVDEVVVFDVTAPVRPGDEETTMTAPMSPDALFALLFGHVRTGVLKAAVDLELFTHIARGKRTVEEIARAAYADQRGVRIVLDVLAVLGLLRKSDDGYTNTPVVEQLLVKDSPLYAGDFTRIIANPILWQAVSHLGQIVRDGKPPEAMVEVPEHEFWVEFSEASERMSQMAAPLVADLLPLASDGQIEVLDVACCPAAPSTCLFRQTASTRSLPATSITTSRRRRTSSCRRASSAPSNPAAVLRFTSSSPTTPVPSASRRCFSPSSC
jgi:hypothetical protein